MVVKKYRYISRGMAKVLQVALYPGCHAAPDAAVEDGDMGDTPLMILQITVAQPIMLSNFLISKQK